MTETERKMRATVRAAIAKDAPPDQVDEITDLIFHAAREAVGTILTVADRASTDAGKIAVLAPAYSILVYLAQEKVEMMKHIAANLGMPTTETKFSTCPGFPAHFPPNGSKIAQAAPPAAGGWGSFRARHGSCDPPVSGNPVQAVLRYKAACTFFTARHDMGKRVYTCHLPGCQHTRERWQTLCSHCFRRLPHTMRQRILQLWKIRNRPEHRRACRDARDWLNTHAPPDHTDWKAPHMMRD